MSMTGYGRGEAGGAAGVFEVEIKSVNHRFLEAKVYLPRQLQMNQLETPLTRRVKEKLGRGKVDVSVRWNPSPEYQPRARFNREVLGIYDREVADMARALGRADEKIRLEFLLGLPGVSETDAPELEEAWIEELATVALDAALDKLLDERRREGAALEEELRGRLDNMEAMRAEIESRRDEVVASFRERLQKKAEDWARDAGIQIDAGRLEAEVMLYVDRSDVTEELVRLKTHIDAFRDALSRPENEAQGKALDFLGQEFLRETNTIASKSRDTGIAALVLSLKGEIEKIKEQVLNVE
jgi:uncharacterized protein (TIGR00255 family)